MKNKKVIFISVLILATGLFFYFSKSLSLKDIFEGRSQAAKAQPPQEHQGHTGGGVQPQQQAPAPQAAEEPPTIEIPSEKQQLIGVKTVVVSAQPLQKTIRTVGRIEYDERRLATVNTKFEGWLEKLYVDYTGKYIKKGEPLAEIYSPELIATQKEFINAVRWKKQSGDIKDPNLSKMFSKDAESIIEAAKHRLRLWDITEEQIKKIEETGNIIRTLTIYSPVSGYITQKQALQGMRVMPGEKLFDVADLSSVWVVADIYEYELPLIKVGQTANISLSYFPGKEFASKIDYIYPALAGETRTAKARFTISNPSGQFKPQMFTNVEIKIGLGRRLAIPEDAVIDTGLRQIVYVDRGDGYFEPREIMPGLRIDGMIEVLKGLKGGEKVASSATFLIDSEAKLKGITAPAGGHKR
jgi:Cu(I)/Ag(I) efflux system membrane fusion protein